MSPSLPIPPGFRTPTIGVRPAAALRELLDLATVVGDAAIPCRSAEDPRAWISDDADEARRAAEACEDCPLVPECRRYATAARELGGVYGGLTAAERLRRHQEDPRRQAAHQRKVTHP